MKRSKLQLKRVTVHQLSSTEMRQIAGGSVFGHSCDGICSSSDPCLTTRVIADPLAR